MQPLSGHTGLWSGTNRFRLMPQDPPSEAPVTARLSLGAGDHVALLTYTWVHPEDGPQEGLLTLGAGESEDSVVGLWGDSWHQTPAVQPLVGTSGPDGLTVGYRYAEGWEWRITLSADGADVLRWRMDNVGPSSASEPRADGGEPVAYWAMLGELRRTE